MNDSFVMKGRPQDITGLQVKSAWMKALRSGHFRQGRGVLSSSSAGKSCHCVLGVLAEIHPAYLISYDENGVGLCDSSLTILDERVVYMTRQAELHVRNDSDMNFEYLANWIHDNIEPAELEWKGEKNE